MGSQRVRHDLRMCTHISGAEVIYAEHTVPFLWGTPLIWCDLGTMHFLLALGSM